MAFIPPEARKQSPFVPPEVAKQTAFVPPEAAKSSFIPPEAQKEPKTLGGFAKNLGQEALGLVDVATKLTNPIEGAKAAYAAAQGIKSALQEPEKLPGQAVELGKSLIEPYTHPIESAYKQPISTALAYLPIAGVASKALRGAKLSAAGRKVAQEVARDVAEKEAVKAAETAVAKTQLALPPGPVKEAPKLLKAGAPIEGPAPLAAGIVKPTGEVVAPVSSHGTWKAGMAGGKSVFVDDMGNVITPQQLDTLIKQGVMPQDLFTPQFTMKSPAATPVKPPIAPIVEKISEPGFKMQVPASKLFEEQAAKAEFAQKIPTIPDLPTARTLTGTEFVAQEMDKAAKGAARRAIVEPALRAQRESIALENKLNPRINQIAKDIGGLKEEGAFKDFIEGVSPAPIGKEAAFTRAKEAYKGITEELANLHDETAKVIGDLPLKRRENFVHHVTDYNIIDDIHGGDWSKVDTALLNKSLRDQPLTGYAKKRLDLIDRDRQMGALSALDTYKNKVVRYATRAKLAKEVRTYEQLAEAAKKPNMSEYLRLLGDRLTGEANMKAASGIRAGSGGFWTTNVSKLLNYGANKFYQSILFQRLGPTVSQIGSAVTNSIYLGPVGAAKSVAGGMAQELWKNIAKASVNPQYQLLAEQYSKVYPTILEKVPSVVEKAALGPGGRTIEKMFNFMNRSLYSGVFNTAYSAARKQGISHAQAVDVADRIMSRSQALYFDTMKPSALTSPIGKLVAPLSTYVFNSFNAMKNDVALSGMTATEKAMTFLDMYAAALMTNVASQAITGKQLVGKEDFIPFYRSLQLGIGGPVASLGRGLKSVSEGQLLRGAAELTPFVPGAIKADVPLILNTLRNINQIKASEGLTPIQSAKRALFGKPYKQK